MQVGDQDRVDLGVVQVLAELSEHAVAAVEQHVGLARLDQEAAAGAPGVLPGGRLAQDCESQLSATIAAPAANTTASPGSAAPLRARLRRPGWPREPRGRGSRASAAPAGGAGPGRQECRAGRSGTARRAPGRRGCGGGRSSHRNSPFAHYCALDRRPSSPRSSLVIDPSDSPAPALIAKARRMMPRTAPGVRRVSANGDLFFSG